MKYHISPTVIVNMFHISIGILSLKHMEYHLSLLKHYPYIRGNFHHMPLWKMTCLKDFLW